jgi:pyruvate/2-oxoacid:ferredoxin oxidoreductase beta subunit
MQPCISSGKQARKMGEHEEMNLKLEKAYDTTIRSCETNIEERKSPMLNAG